MITLKFDTNAVYHQGTLEIKTDDTLVYHACKCSNGHDMAWSCPTPKMPKLTAGQIRFLAYLLLEERQQENIKSAMTIEPDKTTLTISGKDRVWLENLIKEADGRELPPPQNIAA